MTRLNVSAVTAGLFSVVLVNATVIAAEGTSSVDGAGSAGSVGRSLPV